MFSKKLIVIKILQMRKLLLITSIIAGTILSCSKNDREKFAECPTPYILVQADKYTQLSSVGSVEAKNVINDGSIVVFYGTKIQAVNKAFDYKFYIKNALSGEFVTISEGHILDDKTEGQPISFEYKVSTTLKPGIYNAYFSTTCESETSASAYVFTIKENL